jgi:hypothetical protein
MVLLLLLVGYSQKKLLLPRSRRDNDIKKDVTELGHRPWTGLTYLSTCIGGWLCKRDNEPSGVAKFGVFLSN